MHIPIIIRIDDVTSDNHVKLHGHDGDGKLIVSSLLGRCMKIKIDLDNVAPMMVLPEDRIFERDTSRVFRDLKDAKARVRKQNVENKQLEGCLQNKVTISYISILII